MRNVAVLMSSTVRPFELSIFCEVFGIDRSDDGVPAFDFDIVSETPGVPVGTFGGIAITPTAGLDRLEDADLVAVAPPLDLPTEVTAATRSALQGALERGSRVMSMCSGAFILGAAGLLDGRRAATHWMYADELARRFPETHVDEKVLYVDEDPVFTSAGTVAGIDLCLHLIRKDFGSSVANTIARRMVMTPHRTGGQAQFIETTIPDPRRDDGIDALLDWALENLHEDLSIEVLARRTYLSRRSFARRFRAATGTTPYAWIVEQRIRLAQKLLEENLELTIEDIAVHTGFNSAGMLRQHFKRKFNCSPSDYRAKFAHVSSSAYALAAAYA